MTLQAVARQAPLSMGFSRQENWSGLPCPPPGDLPDPGIEPATPVALALKADSLPLSHQGSSKIRVLLGKTCDLEYIYIDIPKVFSSVGSPEPSELVE